MKKVIRLPKALAVHKDLLKKTMTSYVRVNVHTAPPERAWYSKIGGVPYMKKSEEFPVDSNGKPMVFLAQINCQDIKQVGLFPTIGLLQFFMAENGMYGEPEATKVAVRYVEDYSDDLDEIIKVGPNAHYEDLPFNLETSFALSLEKSVEIAPVSDVAFESILGSDFFRAFGDEEYDIRDGYCGVVSATGHKMGGYAHFAQEDPRTPDHDEILLLQLDSDDTIGMKWGDMGVAHFFIKKQDLENRDFSKVTFHWDCH